VQYSRCLHARVVQRALCVTSLHAHAHGWATRPSYNYLISIYRFVAELRGFRDVCAPLWAVLVERVAAPVCQGMSLDIPV
jgi:hypothetical protein